MSAIKVSRREQSSVPLTLPRIHFPRNPYTHNGSHANRYTDPNRNFIRDGQAARMVLRRLTASRRRSLYGRRAYSAARRGRRRRYRLRYLMDRLQDLLLGAQLLTGICAAVCVSLIVARLSGEAAEVSVVVAENPGRIGTPRTCIRVVGTRSQYNL